tara:strand:- start:407 stop:556 length:150 start_codon:yes stop_codon:yes gene_type:complete
MCVANRPVDMSDDFKENGWEYCKYLITDPRSDKLMKRDNNIDSPEDNGT